MDVIELTRRLVSLDTAGCAENAAVALLAPLLEAAGFRLDVVEHEPGRCTLVAEWMLDQPEPPLCLSGHLDTVPFGAAPWRRDPLGAELDGDRLHGRGTTDMKGGVAAIVVAACRVAACRPARAGLRLVLTAAEETGSEGAAAVANRLAGRPSGPLVIPEPTDNVVAFGHKGALWLSAQAHGVTAHGSAPHLGENAVTKLAAAVTRIDGIEFAADDHPVMGRPTLNIGTFHGGLNVNSVPDHAEARVDVRSIPGQKHDLIRTVVSQRAGAGVTLTPIIDLRPVWTDPAGAWVTSATETVRAITGAPAGAPRAMSFFTDAAVLTEALGSVPTIICGPGKPELAHVTDEWCSVTRIRESAEILERICCDWCGC
ncbi:succinyl-diaminopimelate desuccinylase [Amycolatopsis pretoriensis]|uniref:Succinyl-diaminopimelate desuccinylase n=1 Tax=Amycolatopsis pretoriensis TaxID=218821 RepID=A0A1H5QNE7_9PSEU|nr:M20 family metallopeptidase [Amycolatopsis pretoriensis]SEF27663.1 succinyl-diaminopimelate desuccinylase [Amycolatopsis pretoriensis]